MGKNQFLAACCIVIISAALCIGAPPRIVCLGDSITEGNRQHMSYRYDLWKKLVDAGFDFQMVGSHESNFGGTPDYPEYKGRKFDNHNEGHYGWKALEIISGRNNAGKLEDWLKGYTPDIALVYLCTNDMDGKQTVEQMKGSLAKIAEILRAKNPRIRIYLAQILQSDWGAPIKPTSLNAAIAQLAKEKGTAESPIYAVDQNTGWQPNPAKPNCDTWDWVHPNPQGEEKMAQGWFAALMAHETGHNSSPSDKAKPPLLAPGAFNSKLPLSVWAQTEAGAAPRQVGRTPSPEPLKMPPSCIVWGVKPNGNASLQAVALEVRAQSIPGLDLSWTPTTDAGLEDLQELKELQSLNLRGTHVTDAGLEHLKDLSGLRWLYLDHNTLVTDAGLEHLEGLKGLQSLDLRGTKVTDAGLVHLKELKGLHSLNLGETAVTAAGRAALKDALPDCNISR